MSTRVYRTLLLLYPRQFRLEYGDDMVAAFEQMRIDRSPAALWWRIATDAASSITVQRMEWAMSTNKSMLRPIALAALATAVLVTVSLFGVNNVFVFFGTVLVAGALIIGALVYWQANRAYVEPSDELHQYWLRCLVAGAGLIALVNAGSALDLSIPWLVLFPAVISGVMLVAIGVALGLWYAVTRSRPATP